MQTVIVPVCENKNGDLSDSGNCKPVSLATIIYKLFEHTFCLASYHFWPQQTIGLASGQNLALTCVFFHLNRLCLIM